MMNEEGPAATSGPLAQYALLKRRYQQLLDRAAPHTAQRWLGTGGLVAVFILRVVLAQGWYIVCYAHAIYLLNLLLAFLQPKFDPSLEADLAADEIEEGGAEEEMQMPSSKTAHSHRSAACAACSWDSVPSAASADDEFRPFIRRLPEWQFWLSATRATLVALGASLFTAFDVPVYWPILVIYFFVLFALTMRRQIQHMIRYKYVPWDFGKASYGPGNTHNR